MKIKKFFRHSFESIKQVLFWTPIVWNTRDFDSGYLLEMMKIKTERLYNFLSSEDAVSMQNDEDLLALKRCVGILALLRNESFSDPIYERHYEKFPIESFDKFLERINSKTEEERESFRLATKESEDVHKKLVKEFGKLFGKYYRNWWD